MKNEPSFNITFSLNRFLSQTDSSSSESGKLSTGYRLKSKTQRFFNQTPYIMSIFIHLRTANVFLIKMSFYTLGQQGCVYWGWGIYWFDHVHLSHSVWRQSSFTMITPLSWATSSGIRPKTKYVCLLSHAEKN